MPPQTPQARYWLLTIPFDSWALPAELPTGVVYLRGQHERGETGYEHWQLLAIFGRAVRLAAVKRAFGQQCHAEPSRSAAADEYVWKDTSFIDSRFELGRKPMHRNSATDWALVRANAISGKMSEVPDDIFVRYYPNLQRIHRDHLRPRPMARTVRVYWGVTGSGKSHRAFEEAGDDFFIKDPNTKWWCGYQGQENIIIDEFRGLINISHILKWFDKYPVIVETKGGAVPLNAKNIWVTSNLSPDQWYPDLDDDSKAALRRRIEVTHFIIPFQRPQ